MVRTSRGKFFLACCVALVGVSAAFAGCGDEIEAGDQRPGQRCGTTSDCLPGLICSERRCVPTADRPADAGPTDTDAESGPDTGDREETGAACEVGTRTCAGERTVRVCRDGRFVEEPCPRDGGQWVCRGGRCVPDRPCQDSDGDGYGEFCEAGPDCDDDDASINPGAMERCDTPVDDNCDGNVNESCTSCCGSGCGMGQFCDSCSCTSYDADRCEHQLQPCDRRGRSNGYFCSDFGNGPSRCLRPCDESSEDPTSNCTTPNSACVFGDGDRGVCLNGCTLEQGCGLDGLGCLPYDANREGICVPVEPDNEIGDRCGSDSVLNCEAGALCVEDQNGVDRCAEACRPFAESGETDCSSGHCVPVSDRVGICRSDTGQGLGDPCGAEETACGEDAVVCLPDGAEQLCCQELCRLDEGNADCRAGRECVDARPDSDGDVGVCR